MKTRVKFKSRDFSGINNAVHIRDEDVQNMIDEVVEKLMSFKDNRTRFSFSATGDTLVAGVKWAEDGDIEIIVTQDYYQACLIKDKFGNYQPVDWLEDDIKYDDMSRVELIDRIHYLESRLPEYNPRREI